MKKGLLLLLIPAIWAGATWFTSQNTEAVLDEMLAQSNQQVAEAVPFLKIEKTSFEKGFAQSSAQSVITIDPSFFGNSGDQLIQVGLNHAIYHGPVMMTPNGIKTGSSYIVTTLDQSTLPEEIKANITASFGDTEPFVSSVTTGASEMIDTEFTIAPFTIDALQIAELAVEALEEEKFSVSFAGLSGKFTSNMQGTQIKGEMNTGDIKMKVYDGDKNVEFTMAASIIDMDADELYKGTLLDGKIVMTIPSFFFSDDKGTSVKFNGLSFASSAEHDNGLMTADATFDIDNVLIESSSDELDIPEMKLHFRGTVSGVERAAAIKLIDLEQEMNTSMMMAMSSNDMDANTDEITLYMLAYYHAIGEMIKQGVASNTLLDISTKAGEASIILDLNYVNAQQLFAHKTVKELANALQGQLAINIDKSMLAGTPLEGAVGMPIMMGLAVETDDAYVSVADLNSGDLILNGKPTPFLDAMGDELLPWAEDFAMQSESAYE